MLKTKAREKRMTGKANAGYPKSAAEHSRKDHRDGEQSSRHKDMAGVTCTVRVYHSVTSIGLLAETVTTLLCQ